MASNQFSDVTLFEGKSLSDLFQEIYSNSVSKKKQIHDLIMSLTPLVEGVGDATLLVPLIKEYLEIGVKNDEQLVKLAGIVQRMNGSQKVEEKDMWGDLSRLLEEQQEVEQKVEEVSKEVRDIAK